MRSPIRAGHNIEISTDWCSSSDDLREIPNPPFSIGLGGPRIRRIVSQREETGVIRVYATRVPDAVEAIGRVALLAATAPARGARLRRIRNERARERAAVADLLARWALGEVLRVDSRELHLARDSRGRPFLPGAPRTHLSLAHAGEWAACAVGRLPVGVDVEREIPL